MSKKRNNPQATIEPFIADRWSPRAFAADRPVEGDKLIACFEAARWAPSCFGDEPWRFIVCDRVRDPATWQQLLDCLTPRNREWACNAPVLMMVCAATLFRNGKPNRWGQYDTGQAAVSLCLQAGVLGLATHQMGGFDGDAVRKAFSIPDEFTPMAALALGYQADPDILDEGFRETETAERRRQPMEEAFFFGRWAGSD
ncbi:MAG: nitroreductase [Gammaproteobacteria bacterium]|nr:nitroreductase [Gammaproteobacteria bacterium]